jgi:hypothetical protein
MEIRYASHEEAETSIFSKLPFGIVKLSCGHVCEPVSYGVDQKMEPIDR